MKQMKRLLLAGAVAWTMASLADVYIINGERVEGEVHEEGGMKTICSDTMCMILPDDAVKVEPKAEAKPKAVKPDKPASGASAEPQRARLASGFMGKRELLSFLQPRRRTLTVASPEEFSLQGLPRPVLVECWATWCKNSAEMERSTLADPKVKQALKSYTVVKLQCERIDELRKHPDFRDLDIKGLPAFVIFE